jgi:hypothetical protein
MSKLQEKELIDLKELQTKKGNLLAEIGAVEAHKHGYLQLLDSLIQEQEKIKKELEEKYGAISINLEDGSFEEITEEDGKS